MSSLYAKTPEELCLALGLKKKYQGDQIYQWLVKGVTDKDRMSNVPKDVRERMGTVLSSSIKKAESDAYAEKLLISLEDGCAVECVTLTDKKGRKTACISTEAGCQMGCRFCKTGKMGFKRDLKDYEIVEQLVHLRSHSPEITHIVFMGMGEPLNNFGPLMKAITIFHDPKGLNISLRRMTISTCGVVPGIQKLTELKLGVRLAVSLVSADDETRSMIMPVNRVYPLQDLKKALLQFQRSGNDKRITLEYCMLSGVNTTERAAKEVQRFSEGLFSIVNLIPWNPIEGMPYATPSDREIREFTSALDRLGVNYTVRISKGRSIGGACGQLATEDDE